METTQDALAANEAIIRRFYEEIHTRGNLAAIDEFVAPDFVEHVSLPYPGQPTGGSPAVTWFISRFREAFPDLRVDVADLIAARDKVAARVTWSGTHTGKLVGIDPTGKKMRVTGFDIVRISQGKLVEHWGQVDVLELMAQLGFLPQSEEAFL